MILYTKHEHNNTPKYIPSDYVIPLSIEAGAKAKTGLKSSKWWNTYCAMRV